MSAIYCARDRDRAVNQRRPDFTEVPINIRRRAGNFYVTSMSLLAQMCCPISNFYYIFLDKKLLSKSFQVKSEMD